MSSLIAKTKHCSNLVSLEQREEVRNLTEIWNGGNLESRRCSLEYKFYGANGRLRSSPAEPAGVGDIESDGGGGSISIPARLSRVWRIEFVSWTVDGKSSGDEGTDGLGTYPPGPDALDGLGSGLSRKGLPICCPRDARWFEASERLEGPKLARVLGGRSWNPPGPWDSAVRALTTRISGIRSGEVGGCDRC
ncbi:uncharacterized protein EI90DRAFT_3013978 [Cantharellus anzutake]|uniref:uncharacterized protein n=1 Tax=Cantharellus anzutake TaxID=1750568 RepID=UPI0019081A34|nr:uncharacterized protein EI90DRAFT_3013978 [Cantharellus anzutake]KAF8337016.1 hypothetical protein EI90DRAFT_3013978 [Cantharellus anzutake]